MSTGKENVESPVLTSAEAFSAWELMSDVFNGRLWLSSIPFVNGFTRRHANRLRHTFGRTLVDMRDQGITTIPLEVLISEPKDARFVESALAKSIAKRQSYAESHPSLAQALVWHERDLAYAGLQRALNFQLA